MQAPSLFMSQWLCNMSVCDIESVWVCCHPILYICPPSSTQRSLSRRSLPEQKLACWMSLHKQRCVYKVQVRLGGLLSLSVLCFPLLCLLCSEMVWEIRGSFCSSSVDESTSHRNSSPTLSPLIFISLHHTSIIVSVSFFRPSLTPRPPALEALQTTSCLCWSIDPHSCVSVASVWAGLCEIGLLIRRRWVAEI